MARMASSCSLFTVGRDFFLIRFAFSRSYSLSSPPYAAFPIFSTTFPTWG
jgi:hypothetical protein